MARFIILTFGFLALAFYQMSGGASFDPEAARQAAMQQRAESAPSIASEPSEVLAPASAADADAVTRVSLNLTSLRDVLKEEPKSAPLLPSAELTARRDPADTETAEPVVQDGEQVVLPSLIFGGSLITSAEPAAVPAIRQVTGTLVNVRGGPGTDYPVVSQVAAGDLVEVLQDSGSGWVETRPLNGGPVGWMAEFLLGDS